MNRSRYIAQAGLIAAVYAAATLLALQAPFFLGWGPVQFRVSEAVTVLAFFTPAAIPGLTIGSIVANLFNLGVAGPLGILDVVFGSLGTLLGALWTWRFRSNTALGLAGPVITNALIVPAYLPIILKSAGVYEQTYALLTKVPVLGVDLSHQWFVVYLFGVITVAFGQAVVMYGLGLPLLAALRRLGLQDMVGHW